MDILELCHEDKRRERRPFACTHCEKAFARRSDLVRHARIHTNERPFVCPMEFCTKSFIQRSALTVHIRTHTGERPHRCEQCDRRFSDSSSLARHRRVHSGKRPYKCQDCGKTFCRKTTLTKHIKRHHSEPGQPTSATGSFDNSRGSSGRNGSERDNGSSYMPSNPSSALNSPRDHPAVPQYQYGMQPRAQTDVKPFSNRQYPPVSFFPGNPSYVPGVPISSTGGPAAYPHPPLNRANTYSHYPVGHMESGAGSGPGNPPYLHALPPHLGTGLSRSEPTRSRSLSPGSAHSVLSAPGAYHEAHPADILPPEPHSGISEGFAGSSSQGGMNGGPRLMARNFYVDRVGGQQPSGVSPRSVVLTPSYSSGSNTSSVYSVHQLMPAGPEAGGYSEDAPSPFGSGSPKPHHPQNVSVPPGSGLSYSTLSPGPHFISRTPSAGVHVGPYGYGMDQIGAGGNEATTSGLFDSASASMA